MVSEKKKQMLKDVTENIEKYSVIGIADMYKLPARQLHQIKEQLEGKAVIRMAKKKVIKMALEKSKKPGINELAAKIENQPALLFSEGNPFELANTIAKSSSKAPAKEGDISPRDIVIPEGPTPLPPGPAIGELQQAKIPVGVEGDKIVVKKETTIARKGDEISAKMADVLTKLNIEPMEISLNLLAVWDEGTVFGKDILSIPPEHYIEDLKAAYSKAFNLSINIGYVTPDTIGLLLSKAKQEATSLAMEAGIATPETLPGLLSKANAEASALSGLVKDVPEEGKKEPENPEGKADMENKEIAGEKDESGNAEGKKESEENKTADNEKDVNDNKENQENNDKENPKTGEAEE